MVQHVLVCHRLAKEQPNALSQYYLAANPRLIALYVSHFPQMTGEQIRIWPLLPLAQLTARFCAVNSLFARIYRREPLVLKGFFGTLTLTKEL